MACHIYLKNYFSLEDAKIVLFNMVILEKERNRIYYVDNDFFDNSENNRREAGIDMWKYKKRNISTLHKIKVRC